MDQLQIRKTNPEATFTSKKHASDAGYDLSALEEHVIERRCSALIGVGLAFAIPAGYYGQIFSRSSFARDYGLLINAGVIDSGYHGEIKVFVHNPLPYDVTIPAGLRFAQLVIIKIFSGTAELVDDEFTVEQSSRGSDGFGSTN